MKTEFDVFKYRVMKDSYIEKYKYVNECIWNADKISVRNVINELKYISLQIVEFCSLSEIMIPQNIPTGKKGLTVIDASIINYVNEKIGYYSELEKIIPIDKPEGELKIMSIPTKATPDEILNFWLKLLGDNEKGQPYWANKKEIEHFVNQNFDVFPGVYEIRVFNPNMNKSELNHVTWTFYHYYGLSKTKKQYEKLLMQNFTKFKNGRDVYSNIKDQSNEHLKNLFR